MRAGHCSLWRAPCDRILIVRTWVPPAQIHACLYHKQWDARVAAGDAFALLSDAFPNHTAAEVLLGAGIHAGHPTAHSAPTPALVHLDIKVLLEKGTALLASGGQVGLCRRVLCSARAQTARASSHQASDPYLAACAGV